MTGSVRTPRGQRAAGVAPAGSSLVDSGTLQSISRSLRALVEIKLHVSYSLLLRVRSTC